LDFAKDCMYIMKDKHKKLDDGYDEVNAMLYRLVKKWKNYSDIRLLSSEFCLLTSVF